ncbi:MAG TPA: right-handed parallel beta-helix repeat-containing protein [Candidatus Binataceae bacterium]|nr:right-handed parallel beta-helix repeat-containing protein [Candidatus Binataceae bacterium]
MSHSFHLSFIFAVTIAVSVSLGMKSAHAAPPGSCPVLITSCGCVITKPGTYTVGNDLSADQTRNPNCIEIEADHSILNLKGNAVIGDGTGRGIGILIRKDADHVVVQGGDEGNATPPDDAGTDGDDFPAAQAVVTQWNIGIEDDADNAVIELFKGIGGNIFQQDEGNATAGVFINAAKNSLLTDFQASYNGQTGVLVRDGGGSRLSNFSAIGNETGIWLDSSDNNVISTASAAGNSKYGIWMLNSSGNVVDDCNGTSGNGDAGILLGCGTAKCTGHSRSDRNRITNSGAPGNTNGGIVIEKHSNDNVVAVTHNDGNPAQKDMVDLNPHCGGNLWYNNTGSGSQDCIH